MEDFKTRALQLWQDGERDPQALAEAYLQDALNGETPGALLFPLLMEAAEAEFRRLRRAKVPSGEEGPGNSPAKKEDDTALTVSGRAVMATRSRQLDDDRYGASIVTLTAAFTVTPLEARQAMLRDKVWVAGGRGWIPWQEVTLDEVGKTIAFYRTAKLEANRMYDTKIAFLSEAQQLMREHQVTRLGHLARKLAAPGTEIRGHRPPEITEKPKETA